MVVMMTTVNTVTVEAIPMTVMKISSQACDHCAEYSNDTQDYDDNGEHYNGSPDYKD